MRGVGKYTVRRFVVFTPLIIALLWASWWGLGQMVERPRFSCDTPIVNVESGDTLWDIAHRHCSGEVSAVIDTLVIMYGSDLDTWQTIHLPTVSPRP
jgi:hypothetical protein